MQTCIIIAARGKKGHERQASAIAARLGLQELVIPTDRLHADSIDVSDIRVVIGSGRQSISPARRLARRLRGTALVGVLQPVIWRPSEFDFIWAPLHDRKWFDPGARRRIETLTAPSAVSPQERREGALLIDAALDGTASRGRAIGVLVGGATRAHRFGPAEAEDLAARLEAFAAAHEAVLLVSTSRRTGAHQQAILAERLAGTAHILVDGSSAGDTDASLAYAGIIERAQGFIVTADSVAMLSDAASTGKPIAAWRLPGGKARFESLYDGLMAHGALRWFDGSFPQWTYAPLDAAGTIADELRQPLDLLDVAVQHN